MTVGTMRIRQASSGGWLAVVRGTRLVAIGRAPEKTVIDLAWDRLAESDGFQLLLDLLTRDGLAATPPFVLLEWDATGGCRVVVRGSASVTVTGAGGDQVVSGRGVSTWVERALDGVVAFALDVPDAVPMTPAGALPFEAGSAWIAGLTASLTPPQQKPSGQATTGTAAPTAAAVTADVDIEATVTEATVTEAPANSEDQETAESVGATIVALPDPAPEAPQEVAADDGYDYLFGATVFRNVADAAVRADEPEESDAAPDAPVADGDHDGHTVLTADIAGLRSKRRAKGAPPAPAPLQAFWLLLSTGAREALTQPILVGRSPSVSKVSGGQMPRLITMDTADQDISRNHAQVAVEGDTVVVTDLHSRNGTMVLLPGKEPQKLRAGEPTSVIVGTVIDLGGGVTLTVEED
ncbi:FHA domain-containing protein [Lacisediminihabitans sp.]|uniref:FHA domain-containing protein n=1 Tax=Lacisediminihabitans sp. TaxID=2787631 RepID=UPI00374DD7C3